MSDERKPTFALFKNENRKHEKSPEYNLKGTCPHCGTEFRGPGWKKTSGKGLTYIGGPVEIEGENRRDLTREPPKAVQPAPEFNDDIPF